MNNTVLKWLGEVTGSRDFMEPIVEFGALQVQGQEGYADQRRFFPAKEYIGCDLFKGAGVDRIENVELSSFAPGSVGTVLCLETLEHVRHPWEAAREIFRVLKPGGTALVSLPFHLPVHCYPDDYWRMTASGLEVLLGMAGFRDIEASDSGEDVDWDLYWDRPEDRPEDPGARATDLFHFPFSVFAIAVKPTAGELEAEESALRAAKRPAEPVLEVRQEEPFCGTVPIVIALYHREEDTRRVLEQLERVTGHYELVLIDNGFDDDDYLKSLPAARLIVNEDNVGITRALNQGLEVAEGKYIAVLHSDLLIYEEGWLDHIIDFMERRPDVGLVGLAGRHTVAADGSLDDETLVFVQPEPSYGLRPSWRFTEVAVIDGIAWVMRNTGFRLDESLGALHYYDLDISMQYIAAGYRVYCARVESRHLREDYIRSGDPAAAAMTSCVSIDGPYLEARAKFREKWGDMLPITRGFMDEEYAYFRVEELLDNQATMESDYLEVEEYTRKVDEENRLRGEEIIEVEEYTRKVDEENRLRGEEIIRAKEYVALLEEKLAAERASNGPRTAPGPEALPPGPGPSWLEKLGYYLRTEGAAATAKRAMKRLRGQEGRG